MEHENPVTAHAVADKPARSVIDWRGVICLFNIVGCAFLLTLDLTATGQFFAWMGICFGLCGVGVWLFWPGGKK